MVCKILIVDDHPIFREGLAVLLSNEESIEVCGNTSDCSSALCVFDASAPDLVLVDLSLGAGRSGLQLIKILRSRSQSVKLLVVSMHDEILYAEKTLQAGANGYINKNLFTIS